MATSYDDIIDLALVSIRDYKLDKLYKIDEEAFRTVMIGFLTRAIPNFDNCKNDLSLRNDSGFESDLNLYEIDILADWTVIKWLDKEINDVRQITGMMQNKNEAHRYSEANLLKEKVNMREVKREEVDRKQSLYGLRGTDWKSWGKGYDI